MDGFEGTIDGLVNFVKSWADAYIESDTVQRFVEALHLVMGRIGIPSTIHPTADQVVLSSNITILTLLFYYHFIGRSHQHRRRQLAEDLKKAAMRVMELRRSCWLVLRRLMRRRMVNPYESSWTVPST